jgi:peptidoglycan/xylan/chitin deacetylase (PgdA/CDA1 family)
VNNLLNRLIGPYFTIFTLHRCNSNNGAYGGTDEALLKKCLDYASKNDYRFLSIDDVVKESLNGLTSSQPTICFTLDDGYADQSNHLVPLLLDYKAAPTLFVITDFVDNTLWPWDAKLVYLIWNTPLDHIILTIGKTTLTLDLSSASKRISSRRLVNDVVKKIPPELHDQVISDIAKDCQLKLPLSPPEEFLNTNWSRLRELERHGLRVGSHTASHLVFNSANEERIHQELVKSKTQLTNELKNPSSVFCYPLGSAKDFSAQHIHLIKAAGYSAAVSTLSSITNKKAINAKPFQIERIAFPNTFEKFVRYISWKEVVRSKLPF